MKHTPGPWHPVKETDGYHVAPDAAFRDGKRWFADKLASDIQSAADAQLIAAAPELLAALQRLESLDFGAHGTDHQIGQACKAARAALRKAGV